MKKGQNRVDQTATRKKRPTERHFISFIQGQNKRQRCHVCYNTVRGQKDKWTVDTCVKRVRQGSVFSPAFKIFSHCNFLKHKLTKFILFGYNLT